MIGIFCLADDLPALWVYRGLKRRGLVALEAYTPEALVYNRRLEHRLQDNGTFTRIELVDGRVLEAAGFRGVLNRLTALPAMHFQSAVQGDRQYAIQEQHAVFLSWLNGLPGAVINRPGGRGLCGDIRSPAEWTWLAGRAGLPTLKFCQSDITTGEFIGISPGVDSIIQVIVQDGLIYGRGSHALPESIKGPLSRLANMSGLRLFGVDFCRKPDGELFFASANLLPDLRLGGDELLDALAEALN